MSGAANSGPNAATPFLVDSHCHLQYLEPPERRAAVERARARGVQGFLIPATKLDQAEELLAWCEANPFTWCALGVHPHDASTWRDGDEAVLAELVGHPKVVAVGECGLDFFYDHSPREVQEEVLRAQWRVAVASGLPAIVHNRDSNERMLAILGEREFANLRADFHSFAGGVEMAKALVERDCAFGLSGMITFGRADNVREAIPLVPRHRLLVETDTPYLAPVPHRGKPNEPAFTREIAERLANELGVDLDAVAALTTANFFDFFPKAAAAAAAQ